MSRIQPFLRQLQRRGVDYLIPYFRSGWVFLLPYVAVYFLYVWLKWPLNAGPVGAVNSELGVLVPPLLHVFWFVHGLHLILGGFAFGSWWQRSAILESGWSMFWRLLPWLFLGLLFWIPGAYLEYPADPWEHWGRMNRWKELVVIGADPGWFYKNTFYFLAYSFGGKLPLPVGTIALDFYYAVLCLLLSWQYFRLARACGLSGPAATSFAFLQPILLGSNLFGFYRYYILSSTAFAQLGAIVAIRLAVVLSERLRPAAGNPSPASRHAGDRQPIGLLAVSIVGSLFFAAANHLQGVAIGGLGLLGVFLWHVAKYGLRPLALTVGGMGLASVLSVILWAQHPLISDLQRSQGWLNAWGGFDFFSIHSAAAQKMMQVVGIFGLVNLLAGVILLGRNHVAAWLTVTPFLALQCGFISIPLAHVLAKDGAEGIMTFHRFFFAVPAGLAIVVVGQYYAEGGWRVRRPQTSADASRLTNPEAPGAVQPVPSWIPLALLLAVCLCITVISAKFPYNNRLWHSWATVPADLRMTNVLADLHDLPALPAAVVDLKFVVVASAAVSNLLQDFKPTSTLFSTRERLMHYPERRSPSSDQQRIEAYLRSIPAGSPRPAVLSPSPLTYLFTPQSQAGYLSQHWNPTEVSLGFVH